MSKAELRVIAGVYELQWQQEQVSITLERLRERDGDVKAEATVRLTVPEQPSHLHQAGLNLSSTRARKELCQALIARCNHINWADLIEEACKRTLEAHRQGEPVVDVGDHGDNAPMPLMEYQLKPIVQRGQPTVLFGDGGVGKSYLAILMGLLIEYNWRYLGWQPQQSGVLYLDYETDRYTLERRVRMVANGIRPRLDPQMAITILRYRRGYQALADDVAELQRIVAKNNIGTVIVDSVAMACGSEPESAANALRFFSAIRSMNVSSILLAHQSKNALTKTAYGSVFWHNYARNVFEIRREYSMSDNTIYVAMNHRKVNDGRLLDPFGLSLSFEENRVTFSPQDIAKMPTLSQTLYTWQRVESLLRTGDYTTREIQDMLPDDKGKPMPEGTVKSAFTRQLKDKTIRLDSQKWHLLTSGDDAKLVQLHATLQ